jgi:hypothetical protein
VLKVIGTCLALVLLLAITLATWSIADTSLRTAHATEHAAYCARVGNAILLAYSDPRQIYPGTSAAFAFLNRQTKGPTFSIRALKAAQSIYQQGEGIALWDAYRNAIMAEVDFGIGC